MWDMCSREDRPTCTQSENPHAHERSVTNMDTWTQAQTRTLTPSLRHKQKRDRSRGCCLPSALVELCSIRVVGIRVAASGFKLTLTHQSIMRPAIQSEFPTCSASTMAGNRKVAAANDMSTT